MKLMLYTSNKDIAERELTKLHSKGKAAIMKPAVKGYKVYQADELNSKEADMNFNEYQEFCMNTAIYPNRHKNVQHTALGLAGEAGEFANKVKKVQRDQGGRITHESREAMAEELGDALWYIAMAADEINLSLESIVKKNVDKLTSRKSRGVFGGSGDKR